MLLHPRHQTVPGQRYRAGEGRVSAVEDLQQGTFAAAVIAQQTNAVAFFEAEGEIVEQRVKGGINTKRKCSQ